MSFMFNQQSGGSISARLVDLALRHPELPRLAHDLQDLAFAVRCMEVHGAPPPPSEPVCRRVSNVTYRLRRGSRL